MEEIRKRHTGSTDGSRFVDESRQPDAGQRETFSSISERPLVEGAKDSMIGISISDDPDIAKASKEITTWEHFVVLGTLAIGNVGGILSIIM